ncbi:MAG: hypothetical protein ABFE07_09305 [Armatimonadia bacterium]
MLIGRPEGSGAGGGGPEPITLSTAQACSITLDTPGTYIIACTINGGSPNQTFKTAGVSILCETVDPEGRPLRYLGGYETDEDLADPLVAQGWIKMLNRWLHALEDFIQGGGIDTFKVKADATDTAPDFLDGKTLEGDYITLEVVIDGSTRKLQIGCTLEPDDHEVKADSSDTGHGALKDKLMDTATLVWSVDTAGGLHRVKGNVQGIPAADDHKFAVDGDDAAPGFALEKLSSNSLSVGRTRVDGSTPTVSLDVVCSFEAPLGPCPGGNPGTADGPEARPAHFKHQHPLQDIEQLSSEFYAAHLDDPAVKTSVASIFSLETGARDSVIFADAYGGNSIFTEIRPGVFQAVDAGESQWQAYTRGIRPYKGMRSAAICPPGEKPLLDVDKPRQGIYVWTNPGYEGTQGTPDYRLTYAVLERADDANANDDFANGCIVQVTGGTTYAGKWFRLTTTPPIVLGTTELVWEQLNSYTPVNSDNLLTAAQLSKASETANAVALAATAASPSPWLTFPTLPGTPGLDKYPAGRTEACIRALLQSAGDDGSSIWIESQILRDPGGDEEVIKTITTSPITNAEFDVIKAHVDDQTDTELGGDDLAWRIRAVTDSVGVARLAVSWSDAAHSTKLITPLSLTVTGTTDHRALTHKDAENQHPATSVSTDQENFKGKLSSAEKNVQLALDALSRRESARYYLGGNMPAPTLLRFPSQAAFTTGPVAITETAALIFTAGSTGFDPGLVVSPAGNCILRLGCAASVDSMVHVLVKVGDNTIAASDWTLVRSFDSMVEILASSVDPHPEELANTDHVTVEVLAATVSGSGTFTVLSGGSVSTTLTCPWQSEVDSRDHQRDTAVSRGFTSSETADAAAYRHPQRAIAPGRILESAHAAIETSNGLFAIPDKCNFALLDGTEDLIGCSTVGWTEGSWMEFTVYSARKTLKAQNPLPSGYASFAWGQMDTGYQADYDVIAAYPLSTYRFRLLGGSWRLVSSMNM